MRRAVVPLLIAPALVLLAVPGCSPRKVRVSGRLVKNGAVQTYPADQYITLQFVPVEAGGDQPRTYSATIDHAAGTYEVELRPGQYYISVFVPPPPGPDGKPPRVPKPGGLSADRTEFEFKSSTTHDITVP